jgi:translation initiation factor 2B subunit (eIF-2B alpha/beta/delta family)
MKKWIDENGLEIPVHRITTAEKLREKTTVKLLKNAKAINKELAKFKAIIDQTCQEVFQTSMQEAGGKADKTHKGNFSFYNFDRSIKVEVNISEYIAFDEILILAAKEKFNTFLELNTGSIDEMIRQLIMDAFSTYKGKLDVKKIMNLLRYRSKISEKRHPEFHEAIDLIEQSIRRPGTKKYFRISEKDENGKYNYVELNFSSI